MNPLYIDSQRIGLGVDKFNLYVKDLKTGKLIEKFESRNIPYDSIFVEAKRIRFFCRVELARKACHQPDRHGLEGERAGPVPARRTGFERTKNRKSKPTSTVKSMSR
jgi:hypothetical protein